MKQPANQSNVSLCDEDLAAGSVVLILYVLYNTSCSMLVYLHHFLPRTAAAAQQTNSLYLVCPRFQLFDVFKPFGHTVKNLSASTVKAEQTRIIISSTESFDSFKGRKGKAHLFWIFKCEYLPSYSLHAINKLLRLLSFRLNNEGLQ